MAIQWFETSKTVCQCVTDQTQVSTVIAEKRGKPRVLKRSRQVRHWREVNDAYFWHWEDQTVHDPSTTH